MSNEGAGSGPSLVPWPWSPIPLDAPPSEAFNIDDYRPKIPWVNKIHVIYERPLPGEEVEREFKSWQNGLFYSLPLASLQALVNFPAKIKSLGDKAKTFTVFYVHGRFDGDSGTIDDGEEEKDEQEETNEGDGQHDLAPLSEHDSEGDDRESTAIDTNFTAPKLKRKASMVSVTESVKSSFKTPYNSLRRKFPRHDSGPTKLEEIAQGPSKQSSGSARNTIKEVASKIVKYKSTEEQKQLAAPTPPVKEASEIPMTKVDEKKSFEKSPTKKKPKKKKSKSLPRNKTAVPNAVNMRDGMTCVIMKTKGACHLSHITPFSINSSPEALEVFEDTFVIAVELFGDRFASELRRILGSSRSSDKSWNIATFNPYIHGLLEKGLVNLKPLYIEEKPGEIMPVYLATFSFHWMFKNKFAPSESLESSSNANFIGMFLPDEEFKDTMDSICAYDIHGRRIPDGRVIQIPMNCREYAENMLSSMAIRWAAGQMWCLQGGAGLGQDDDLDGNDDDNGYSLAAHYYDKASQEFESKYFTPLTHAEKQAIKTKKLLQQGSASDSAAFGSSSSSDPPVRTPSGYSTIHDPSLLEGNQPRSGDNLKGDKLKEKDMSALQTRLENVQIVEDNE
ncbi:hypothetical protein PWT90_10255 [Aphanocladium album]|nr:hypothetical protein PWT90_10255 [Aphanocladium album]